MSLSRDELWDLYTRKNPHWLTEGATFTPAGVRKLFEQTFDLGHRLGMENGKALAETGNNRLDFDPGSFAEIMHRYFAGKGPLP